MQEQITLINSRILWTWWQHPVCKELWRPWISDTQQSHYYAFKSLSYLRNHKVCSYSNKSKNLTFKNETSEPIRWRGFQTVWMGWTWRVDQGGGISWHSLGQNKHCALAKSCFSVCNCPKRLLSLLPNGTIFNNKKIYFMYYQLPRLYLEARTKLAFECIAGLISFSWGHIPTCK